MTFDQTEKRAHDYVRHGTVNLFEALDVATGKIIGECYPRWGSEEFLAFMKTVAAQYADREVHVVVDNLGTHFTPEVRDGLANNPNITFHRTPVGASWINQIELVWLDYAPSDPPRNIQLGQTAHHHDPQLHHQLERQLQALHLDC